MIEKSAVQQEPDGIVKSRFKIAKSDDDKMLAFGWASIAIRANGEVIEDWQNDIIEPEVLEEAAYDYVRLFAVGGEMHDPDAGQIRGSIFRPSFNNYRYRLNLQPANRKN